jgi:hypothetical protein
MAKRFSLNAGAFVVLFLHLIGTQKTNVATVVVLAIIVLVTVLLPAGFMSGKDIVLKVSGLYDTGNECV